MAASKSAVTQAPEVSSEGNGGGNELAVVDTDERLAPTSPARTIAIVIPAFNEEEGIGDVLRHLREAVPDSVTEIIVVSDGSSDRTEEIAAAAGVHVIRHNSNRGYGASLKTGIVAAQTDYILTMDADGQHRLEDIVALCQHAQRAQRPDCVVGERTQLLHSPLWRMPGKWLLTALAQFLTKKKIPDLNSGLRLMHRDVVMKYMRLCPQGFSFSTTITMALLSRGYDITFVPIRVEQRVGKSSVTLSTGFQTILLALRLATLFNPLRVFLPASFFSIVAGVVWGARYVLAGEGVTVASMLAILTGVLLFALGLMCDQIAQLRLERYE